MALGERLRAARVAAGFRSQAALAAALGVERNTVGRAELGIVVPHAETLRKWAQLCGASLDELLADDTVSTIDPTASGPDVQRVSATHADAE
jgi:transcriptional regulator with XRE-family HTH domain